MKVLGSFEYEGRKLTIKEVGVYKDGSKAIRIFDHEEPFVTLTVNLNCGQERPRSYLIKTWSENSIICPALLEQGIFWDTGIRRPVNGEIKASVWSLNV